MSFVDELMEAISNIKPFPQYTQNTQNPLPGVKKGNFADIANIARIGSKIELPIFCRPDCPGHEPIDLPNEGLVVGCIHPITNAWRRLDMMTECPAMHKSVARPVLPEWCMDRCDHYHRLGAVQWCCQESDETHWRRARLDSMTGCPEQEKAKSTRFITLACGCQFDHCTMLGDRWPLECHWREVVQ